MANEDLMSKVSKLAGMTDRQVVFFQEVVAAVRRGVENPAWDGADVTISKVLDKMLAGD